MMKGQGGLRRCYAMPSENPYVNTRRFGFEKRGVPWELGLSRDQELPVAVAAQVDLAGAGVDLRDVIAHSCKGIAYRSRRRGERARSVGHRVRVGTAILSSRSFVNSCCIIFHTLASCTVCQAVTRGKGNTAGFRSLRHVSSRRRGEEDLFMFFLEGAGAT